MMMMMLMGSSKNMRRRGNIVSLHCLYPVLGKLAFAPVGCNTFVQNFTKLYHVFDSLASLRKERCIYFSKYFQSHMKM